MTLSKDEKDRVMNEVAFMTNQNAIRPSEMPKQRIKRLTGIKTKVRVKNG
jgi:hypothetical protein